MAVAAPPDFVIIHRRLLGLLSKAEAVRDATQPEVPVEVQELIDELEHYLEQVENILDARESREALKEGVTPWSEVKARLKPA